MFDSFSSSLALNTGPQQSRADMACSELNDRALARGLRLQGEEKWEGLTQLLKIEKCFA